MGEGRGDCVASNKGQMLGREHKGCGRLVTNISARAADTPPRLFDIDWLSTEKHDCWRKLSTGNNQGRQLLPHTVNIALQRLTLNPKWHIASNYN